jgi:ABC-type antimicrobial peptide transport system permease subunit
LQSRPSLLFGITLRDAFSLSLVPIALAVVSIVACALPAARAARVDPLILLRED